MIVYLTPALSSIRILLNNGVILPWQHHINHSLRCDCLLVISIIVPVINPRIVLIFKLSLNNTIVIIQVESQSNL